VRIAPVVALLIACREAAPPGKLELVEAPAGADVPALVAAERDQAARERRDLVVYVGASWCEPCVHFHDAAAAGQLDEAFGDLRFLVFDADRDTPRLEAAGYRSNMIPLFAIPRDDGTASGRQMAGSIKGPGAVDQIAPRLRALVDGR
jgi:thiol-disulfide isomerase/thioredoxin